MTNLLISRTRAHLAFLAAAMLLATCGPANVKPAPAEAAPAVVEAPAMIKPSKTGYADVNGIKFYHEIYGSGDPLVLAPGGFMTIEEMQTWIQPLAKTRQVIAVELQGHGHTADTDRAFTMANAGDDIAALIDALGIKQADVMGYSMGADAALNAAFRHPDKVRRLVIVSAPYKFKAWYPEAQVGMGQVNSSLAEGLKATPTGRLVQTWPQPERFPKFLDKVGEEMKVDYDWSKQIKALKAPVQLIFADNDSIPVAEQAAFFNLLGGSLKEPGWMDTKITTNRLAVVPGYSHYNFFTSTEVPAIADKFLADPLDGTAKGGAAASTVEEPKKN